MSGPIGVSSVVSYRLRSSAWKSAVALAGACLLAGLLTGCGSETSPEEMSGDAANVVPSNEVERRVGAARTRLTQSEGGRRVLRAIEAHGGLEAWYRAPTSSYTWEYTNEGAGLHFKSFLVVDNRTRRAYHELLFTGTPGNTRRVDARFAWDGERAWVAPDSIQRPNPRFWALTGFYFQQIPFVLADPGLNYTVLPDDTIDGTPHDMVEVTFDRGVGDAPGDTYTLYLDKETGRVDAIRYTVSYGRDVDPGADLPETFFDYEDYVTVDGLTVPTHFKGYSYAEDTGRGNTLRNEAFADSISYRRPFDASKVEPPANARMVPLPGE